MQYAKSICEFLDKAHRFETVIDDEPYHRIVHADLKPDHILIPGPDRIKVLDFGIAKALARTTLVTTNNWGTRAYSSPERLESGHVNEHVDLWSLGVMLYEMVSGHRPYRTSGTRRERARARDQNECASRSTPQVVSAGIGGDHRQAARGAAGASVSVGGRDRAATWTPFSGTNRRWLKAGMSRPTRSRSLLGRHPVQSPRRSRPNRFRLRATGRFQPQAAGTGAGQLPSPAVAGATYRRSSHRRAVRSTMVRRTALGGRRCLCRPACSPRKASRGSAPSACAPSSARSTESRSCRSGASTIGSAAGVCFISGLDCVSTAH